VTGSNMQYLDNIGSYLPGLPVESAWQFLQEIDTLYLAVAGGFLLFTLIVILAVKKWKARQIKTPQTKSQENKKPPGTKNIKNEEAEQSKPAKWKKPEPKPSAQKLDEKPKSSSWLGGLTEKIVPIEKEKRPSMKPAQEEQKKGWFSFSAQQDTSKDNKTKEAKAGSKDSFMKPVTLNIDPNPVPRDVLRKQKEGEIQRVRRMCGEFREVVKVTNKEEREEKQKEMEKVRSARSYFKAADRYRSESLSGNPRIRFRTEEEVNDSYSRGNHNRLSQFTPGKINSRFTDMFDGEKETDLAPQKPPKKKIISLDQVMKQGSPKNDEHKISKELELEDLKESRRKWRPPPVEKPEPTSNVKDEIINLQFETVPLKLRWNPTDNNEKEEIQSLDIPNKLNIEKVFPTKAQDEDVDIKKELEKELDEVRSSRPSRFQKIGKEQRSSSAHVLHRTKLADDAWVVEKSESRIAEERRKAVEELELVKKSRLETLETLENMEIERPSSRMEDQVRLEAMKELEEVRRVRTVTLQGDEMREEVTKILKDQLVSDESSNEVREELAANKIKISQHNDLSKRHEIEDLVAETVEMKCADSKHDIKHQEGAIDGVINIDDTNASENEQSIKITEEKGIKTRPEEVDDKIKDLNAEDIESQEHLEDNLEERVKDMTELGDIKSLDIAMAIAAGEILEFEKFRGAEVDEKESYEELDEEFEEKKKMIEEELRQIEEQYKAVQEQASQDESANNEVISPAESYEELTERLLKVAESIQDSAKRLGNDDIDLTPRIDRIQNLRDECHLSNQSLAGKEEDKREAKESDLKDDVVLSRDENQSKNIKIHITDEDTDLHANKSNVGRDQHESSSEVKFRNTKNEDLGQFQPAKMNSKFKNIFENTGNTEEVEIRKQPKKKLITLDQVLIKSASQDMKHEKEVELEIVKNLRKNWVPPEEPNIDIAQTKLEPKKLQIEHVYGNDSRDGPEKFKQMRQRELEEVRQSAPLAARWTSEETGETKEGNRSRPRSAMKVTQSDDFWLKLKSDEKVEEEKLKVFKEIESIKQARLKFEDEPEERQEDDARLKTLQELESLRLNQKQTDNSVKKIKRDLEEINRSVVEKENKDKSFIDFEAPTEQWKKEREKIKETFNTKQTNDEEVRTVTSKPTKLNKIMFKEESPPRDVKDFKDKTSNKIIATEKVSAEADTEKTVENNNSIEDKARTKLKEIKNLEIFKLKEKTLKLTQKIETERGRRRELKRTETKENVSLRSKSISTLKNAGQKIKSLTNEKLKVVMKSKSGEDHADERINTDQ